MDGLVESCGKFLPLWEVVVSLSGVLRTFEVDGFTACLGVLMDGSFKVEGVTSVCWGPGVEVA